MKTNDSTLKLIFIAVFALSTMGLVPVMVNMIAANEITIGIARLGIGAIGIAIIAYFVAWFVIDVWFVIAWFAIVVAWFDFVSCFVKVEKEPYWFLINYYY